MSQDMVKESKVPYICTTRNNNTKFQALAHGNHKNHDINLTRRPDD